MIAVQTIDEVRKYVKAVQKEGKTVGLVPTMGFLHEGHESLIRESVKENDITGVSIFVNPTQFQRGEDLEDYPRDLKRDLELCRSDGADIVFCPDVKEMYGEDFLTFIDMERITDILCGKSRENHFKGVCTVVGKLFNIFDPDRAYFGKKDAQQLAVVKQMVKDLNFDLDIIGVDTVRDPDGLAKSSRNTYLSSEERKAATVINKALIKGKEMVESGESSPEKVEAVVRDILSAEPMANVEYISVVSWPTLMHLEINTRPMLMAVAVKIGKVRLIDNFILE